MAAMALSLVIFDCDGVLVDSEAISNRLLVEELNAEGFPITLDEALRDFVGLRLRTCCEMLSERHGRAVPEARLVRYRARVEAEFRASLKPVPGVREALDAIDLPVCVASSGAPEKMRLTLGLCGLWERFEGRIFSARQVARGKPHPDLFLFAAERMGAAPEGCAVIEDSEPGVRAAVAAGMRAFGYVGGFNPHPLAALGAVPFHDMRELPALLRKNDANRTYHWCG
jgi:HAD superfamily hydrolase (TIGR01509 family)